MGKGYHSRSPDEFREYLKSLNQKNRSHFLKQIIILVDIVLIMVIFYMIHQMIAPSPSGVGNKTTIENFQNIRLTLSSSHTRNDIGAFLYLILENKLSKPVDLTNWGISYQWKTNKEETCDNGILKLHSFPKILEPNSTHMLEIFVPPPNQNLNLPKGCKKEHLIKRNFFSWGKSYPKLLLEISIHDSNENQNQFYIYINPFKE